MIRAAVIVLALLASGVRAQDKDLPTDDRWVVVYEDDWLTQLVDSHTLAREGDVIRAWNWVALAEVDTTQEGLHHDRTISLIEIHCSKRLMVYLSSTLYLEGVPGPASRRRDVTDIIPGSVGEVVAETVCGYEG